MDFQVGDMVVVTNYVDTPDAHSAKFIAPIGAVRIVKYVPISSLEDIDNTHFCIRLNFEKIPLCYAPSELKRIGRNENINEEIIKK